MLYWTSLIFNRYYLIYFQVVRIVIRNRMAETNQLKGFVELRDSSDAANVISVLNGANIYDDCCTLEVRLVDYTTLATIFCLVQLTQIYLIQVNCVWFFFVFSCYCPCFHCFIQCLFKQLTCSTNSSMFNLQMNCCALNLTFCR